MQEKRRNVRRTFEQPAWIVAEPGAEPLPCTVRDVSKSGARLSVPPRSALPPGFVLHLASNGAVARKCLVVWRSQAGDEVGVEFTARRASPA